MLILFGLVLVLAALVGGGVWLLRSSRAEREALEVAMAELREEIGAPAAPAPATGAWHGRPCSVGRLENRGSHVEESTWSRVTVAVRTDVTLELHPQETALAARLAGDVEIGDDEFDAAFIVRTSDPERLARALAPDVRRQLREWRMDRALVRVWILEGRLNADCEEITRPADVDRARAMLAALDAIASGLERHGD